MFISKTKIKVISILISIIYLFSFNAVPVFAAISYTYDANGNMTSDGTNCYTYNDANQLSQVTNCGSGQTVAQYLYDYQGNRIEKKIYTNGTLQKTVYSPNNGYETVKLSSNGATLNTTYYQVNDQTIAKKNPDGTKNYYLNDNLGSTNVLTDQNGNVVEKTTYYPYGEVRSGGTQSKYLYTGQENDAETALDYYNSRYYEPHIQRFTQPDTLLTNIYNPQSLNRYSYVENNPLRYTDPSGHDIFPLLDLAFITYDIVSIVKQPLNTTNWIALGIDVATALIPFVPEGGGLAFRIAEHSISTTEKASELVKTTDKVVPKVAEIEKSTAEASKTTSHTGNGSAYSTRYLSNNPETGWKLGDPINNLTSNGVDPSWNAVRQRFWKTEALHNAEEYTAEDLARMKRGLAPQQLNSINILEPLELDHVPPQREGGLYDFDIVTHEEHSARDPFRH
jgi:RHS repeat-associated protein